MATTLVAKINLNLKDNMDPLSKDYLRSENIPPSVDNKIILAFGWKSESSSKSNEQFWGILDLIFKGMQTEINVNIPKNMPSNKIQKLSFTCRKNQKESTCDMIKVAIEQIQNLKIKAVFFNDGPNKNSATMDTLCQTTLKKYKHGSDSELKLEILEELEIGKKYYIVITSNDLNLKARLIKDTRIAAFSKYHIPNEIITHHIFSFLSPGDLCRVMRVCKMWRNLGSNLELWKAFDLKKLSPLLKIFDESVWKSYYDLSPYGINFDDSSELDKKRGYFNCKKAYGITTNRRKICSNYYST